MQWVFDNIFNSKSIEGPTINSVPFSPEFNIICYALIIIISISSTFFFLIRKTGLGNSIRKAVLTTFFFVGLLCAIHSDIIWSGWIEHDLNKFAGLGTEDKVLAADRSLYKLALAIKNAVPERYALFSSFPPKDYFNLRLEYFLLPLRKNDNSDFLIVTADEHIIFNPETGILKRETVFDWETGELIWDSARLENLSLLYKFKEDAYILVRK